MKDNIVLLLALLLLTSCASPYQAREEQLEAYMTTIQSGLEREGWSHVSFANGLDFVSLEI